MDGLFPGQPQSFRHQRRPMDDCSPGRGGEWRRTAEQRAEHFMAKWIAAEKAKAGLRHAEVCPSVTGETTKRTAQIKRARAGSLALVDSPQVARTCILRAFDLQMSLRLSLVLLRLFCIAFAFLSFRLYDFVEAAALRSIVLRYAGAPISPQDVFFFFFLRRCRFIRFFFGGGGPFPPSPCMESNMSYVLSFRMVFFLPRDHGMDFLYQLM